MVIMVSESFNNQEYMPQLLYENLLPIIIFDTGGEIVDFNRAFIDFSGYGDESLRGFAVVVQEVRNLAGESKTATARISHLIDEIKNESDVTTRSMETSHNEISEAITSFEKTIESLNGIVNLANEASVGVIEIAKASEMQSNATAPVMGSMEQTTGMNRANMERIIQVAPLSEDVSASIEEIGMGTAELSDMAKSLKNILEEYRF